MAIFSGTVRSHVLHMDTGINIILPYDRPAENQQKPCKVLYLLHGMGNNCTSWCRNTNIEKYAQEYGYAVVMPEADQSFYINEEYGLPYFDYISEELPQIVEDMFNVSNKPEDTFIAGVSMGGYGAMKIALTNPHNYAGCCSFSGAVDLNFVINNADGHSLESQLIGVIGSEKKLKPENDVFELAAKLKSKLPLYVVCGTEDYLHEDNVRFVDHLKKLGLNYRYEEWTGIHDWNFWDEALPKALKFFNNI